MTTDASAGGVPEESAVRTFGDLCYRMVGRFGIVMPRSGKVILFGRDRLWQRKEDAEFHLRLSRKYATPGSELHSAYVGEIGEDSFVDG